MRWRVVRIFLRRCAPPLLRHETVRLGVCPGCGLAVNDKIPEMARRWIVDAHREGRRYIVHSGGLPSAFLWLKSIGLKERRY